MRFKARVLACVVTAGSMLLLNGTISWAGSKEAAAAYRRQNYATVLVELRPLAAQGDPEAEWFLGVMYDEGKGVEQNYERAALWYRQSAQQGDARGQFNLCKLYYIGEGVPRDLVLAHMWCSLSAAHAPPSVRRETGQLLNLVAKSMTRVQLAEGKKLASQWKPKVRVREGAPRQP